MMHECDLKGFEHDYEVLPIREYVTNIYQETSNPSLLRILDEEKRRVGLGNVDIAILLPDEPKRADSNDPFLCGDVSGSRESWYSVVLYPIAMKGWDHTPREVIRHELGHINQRDTYRKLPPIIRELYRSFVQFLDFFRSI